MKIKNKKTNIVFNLPKEEVEVLLKENPDMYEKITRGNKKKQVETKPEFEQDTILPLIWEE